MATKRKVYNYQYVNAPINEENERLMDDEEASVDTSVYDPPKQPCVKQRYILAAVSFFGFAIAYAARINLSVAMVAMVNETYVHLHDDDSNKTKVDTCPELDTGNSSEAYKEGEFAWTPYTQGIVSGSFFYGYLLTQLLGGYLADKYGAKHVLGLSIMLSTLVSTLSPITARTNMYLFIAVRVIEGLLQGPLFSAVTSMMGRWAPIFERSFLNSFRSMGVYFGIIVAFPVSGLLCESGFLGGWPSAFYVFGILGIVWYPFWLYFTTSSPQTHPRITPEELRYIQLSIPTPPTEKPPVPWKQILTSIRVIAVIVAIAGAAFSYGALLAFLPMYMEQVLKFSIVAGGLCSIAPYIASLISSLFSGYLADFLSVKLHSVTAARRIMTISSHITRALLMMVIPIVGCNRVLVILLLTACGFFGNFTQGGCQVNAIDLAPQYAAHFIAALLMILIPTAGCSRIGVILLLALSAFFQNFQMGGCIVSPIDLAPQFAGIIMGLSNTAATICMILGPYVTGSIINDAQTLEAWGRAFYVMAAIMLASGLFYMVFVSGELQPWAATKQEVFVDRTDSDVDKNTDTTEQKPLV